MLIAIVFCIVGKPVYLPLQWCPTCKDHAFVGWAAQLIMWVAPKSNLPKVSANAKQCILLLILILVLSYLVDLMIKLSISILFIAWSVKLPICLVCSLLLIERVNTKRRIENLGKFDLGASHIISCAAHPTNAWSLQVGHHCKGK